MCGGLGCGVECGESAAAPGTTTHGTAPPPPTCWQSGSLCCPMGTVHGLLPWATQPPSHHAMPRVAAWVVARLCGVLGLYQQTQVCGTDVAVWWCGGRRDTHQPLQCFVKLLSEEFCSEGGSGGSGSLMVVVVVVVGRRAWLLGRCHLLLGQSRGGGSLHCKAPLVQGEVHLRTLALQAECCESGECVDTRSSATHCHPAWYCISY
ncbi:hypothetical protein E2C01_049912 [Portunus trituberculatus]|uniref:Uncharacterized protein n=1 Tax=Portunus trituberculatus TaxID=210409 RepID=A0A5B7GHE0_PORTR|nr:hypothetical protein [Portunus trituberculatus]